MLSAWTDGGRLVGRVTFTDPTGHASRSTVAAGADGLLAIVEVWLAQLSDVTHPDGTAPSGGGVR